MNHPQQPREYDAVLGGNSPSLEGAAVLGGIEGVKLRLQNPDSKVRIAGLDQALNYGEQGLDLVIAGLKDKSWDIRNAAYLILNSRTEPRIKQLLQNPNQQGLKLEQIEVVTVNKFGKIIQRQPRVARYFIEDLGNGVKLEMAAIPGGTFMMGSPENEIGRRNNESPQHQVTVPSFFMGKYPLTQKQYQAIMGNNPSYFKGYFKGKNRPIEAVTWNDAVTFCQRLSQRTGRNYTLPTEAQWEYACRAGTTTPFYFGESITSDLVNCNGNIHYGSAPKGKYRGKATVLVNCNGNIHYGSVPKGKYRGKTTVVGSFPPNIFGLYDMHGNVWEFCLDDWVNDYNNPLKDSSVVTSLYGDRIIRGGSLSNTAEFCRSAFRVNCLRDGWMGYIGFRVVVFFRTQ
jgi:formylglycine-generating enzyme required for sulfatase activity